MAGVEGVPDTQRIARARLYNREKRYPRISAERHRATPYRPFGTAGFVRHRRCLPQGVGGRERLRVAAMYRPALLRTCGRSGTQGANRRNGRGNDARRGDTGCGGQGIAAATCRRTRHLGNEYRHGVYHGRHIGDGQSRQKLQRRICREQKLCSRLAHGTGFDLQTRGNARAVGRPSSAAVADLRFGSRQGGQGRRYEGRRAGFAQYRRQDRHDDGFRAVGQRLFHQGGVQRLQG